MATVQIRRATLADKDAIFRVHYEALAAFHAFYAAFFKANPRDSMPVATELALKKPDNVFLVAEEAGCVVGFIRYSMVAARSDVAAGEVVGGEEDGEKAARAALWEPKEHLVGIWKRFKETNVEMDVCKERAANGECHIYIHQLMIHPFHQRKGIGRVLLDRVLARADAAGVSTLLTSSAEARGLYAKKGFEVLGVWTIDDGRWAREVLDLERSLGMGGDEGWARRFEGVEEVEACMIRRWRG